MELGGVRSLGRARNQDILQIEDICRWLDGWQLDRRESAPSHGLKLLSILWVCVVSSFVSQGGLDGLSAHTPMRTPSLLDQSMTLHAVHACMQRG